MKKSSFPVSEIQRWLKKNDEGTVLWTMNSLKKCLNSNKEITIIDHNNNNNNTVLTSSKIFIIDVFFDR